MYKAVVLLVVVLLGVFAAEAQKPNLKLPFPAGETWEVSRGYNPDGDPLHENSSHRNYGYWADDRYALDFNLQENADLGRPVLAVAPGTVISVSYDGGWGNTVIIDHGNGYRSRYSHLDSFSVKVDQLVIQGYEVGKCGTTGNSTGPHIHFALYHNGVAELPEPMSGYTGFVNGGKYISDNYGLPVGRRSDGTISQQIVDAFDDNGGIGSMGSPLSRYIDGQSRPQTVWQWGTCEIQVFDNGTLGECAIVYDLNANYALAYVLHGRLWQYFKANHGPWMNVVNGSTINSLGGPIDRERFAFDLASGQTLSVQKMAYGWLVFNAATGQSCALGNDSTFRVDYPDYGDTGVGGGSDVGIAIVPGDGQTLSLWVQAQSPTSVYLTNNAITGAAEYWYYRNGQFLG
ncbi:MAG: M23 family metallopeptidase, partial [Patescibacteria group bacterium]|nr:M23 family metallopeptidase [Patescibacteria group bacterium]